MDKYINNDFKWVTAKENNLGDEKGYSITHECVHGQESISWISKEEFEKSHRLCKGVPFGQALEALKFGWSARLPSWGKDVFIRAQFPDENSKMTAPYLYVESRFGCVPWNMTEIELFSDDWVIYP